MPKKLTKQEEEWRVILNNFVDNECVNIELDYLNHPVVCKLFSNKFDYSKIFKAGIPSYETISEQLGCPEVKLSSIMIPSYFYKYYLDDELEIYSLQVSPSDTTKTCEFIELVCAGDTLLTIYSEDSAIRINNSFDKLKEALKHKDEISKKLKN